MLFSSPYLNKRVKFIDPVKNFWRIGTCVKEEGNFRWIENCVNKRFKISISDEIELVKENESGDE